jgi:hypothetical protein
MTRTSMRTKVVTQDSLRAKACAAPLGAWQSTRSVLRPLRRIEHR